LQKWIIIVLAVIITGSAITGGYILLRPGPGEIPPILGEGEITISNPPALNQTATLTYTLKGGLSGVMPGGRISVVIALEDGLVWADDVTHENRLILENRFLVENVIQDGQVEVSGTIKAIKTGKWNIGAFATYHTEIHPGFWLDNMSYYSMENHHIYYMPPSAEVYSNITVFENSAHVENGWYVPIRPGGSYTIVVQVHKPSFIALPETMGPDGWEVRAYFYNENNCYNTGSWWNPSGDTWLYTGWWDYRIRPGAWAGIPEDNTFTIPNIDVVDNQRPQVDRDNGMNDIPVPGNVSLGARLLIKNIGYKIDGQHVTFRIGGAEYRYLYKEDNFGNLDIFEDLESEPIASIDRTDDRLVIDQTMSVNVSSDAPAIGTIYIPSPINIHLKYSFLPADVLNTTSIIITIIILVVVSIGVAITLLKKRKQRKRHG